MRDEPVAEPLVHIALDKHALHGDARLSRLVEAAVRAPGAQKSFAAHGGRVFRTAPTWRQSLASPERSTGKAGSQLPDVAVAYQPLPARRIDGSG